MERYAIFIYEAEQLKNSYGNGVKTVDQTMWKTPGITQTSGKVDVLVYEDASLYWTVFSILAAKQTLLPKVFVKINTYDHTGKFQKAEVQILYNVRVTKVQVLFLDEVGSVLPVRYLRIKLQFANTDERQPTSAFPFLENILAPTPQT